MLILLVDGCGKQTESTVGSAIKTVPIGTAESQTAKPDSSPSYGDTLVMHLACSPQTLNPILCADGDSLTVISLLFNGLVKYDDNLKLTGDLAETWEVSTDELSVTFHLRKGVKWQDGEPFDADDVKFNYEKLMDPAVQTISRDAFSFVSTLEIPDKFTVKVINREKNSSLVSAWGQGLVPRHLYEKDDFNNSNYNRFPVGTGPFKLTDWKPDEQIILQANDDYFLGRPFLNRIKFKLLSTAIPAFSMLLKGEIDLMTITLDQYETHYKEKEFNDKFSIYLNPSPFRFVCISYNLLRPYFSDKKVRKAVTMCIDREKIIREVRHGHGVTVSGPFAPGFWANDDSIRPLPFSTVEAAVLLKEAGWTDSDGDGILEKDGVKFQFTIQTINPNTAMKYLMEIVQNGLAQAGIKMTPEYPDYATLMTRLQNQELDALLLGWQWPADPDPYMNWHSSQIPDPKKGKAGSNYFCFKDDEADRIMDQLRKTLDFETRKNLLHRFHAILHEEQPCTFLYPYENVEAISKRFQGIVQSPWGLLSNSERFYVPMGLQKYQ